MRVIRFAVLPLLMLVFAIPAAAGCSSCFTSVDVSADGPTKQYDARCEPNTAGDIPDCQVINIGGTPMCTSGQKIASCAEYFACPPWDCPIIILAKDPRVQPAVRPVLSAM